jgi:hypothetical protein
MTNNGNLLIVDIQFAQKKCDFQKKTLPLPKFLKHRFKIQNHIKR